MLPVTNSAQAIEYRSGFACNVPLGQSLGGESSRGKVLNEVFGPSVSDRLSFLKYRTMGWCGNFYEHTAVVCVGTTSAVEVLAGVLPERMSFRVVFQVMLLLTCSSR